MIVKTDGSFAALVVTLLPSQSSTTFVRRGGSLSTTAHSDTARGKGNFSMGFTQELINYITPILFLNEMIVSLKRSGQNQQYLQSPVF